MKTPKQIEKEIIQKLDYGSTVGLAIVAIGFLALIIRNVFFL
jgi:hypothetical protein